MSRIRTPEPRIRPELGLLAVACFLATIIGGQVSTDALPFSSLVDGVFGGGELPLTARAVVGTMLLLGAAMALWKHGVVQLPKPSFTVLAIAIVGFSALSITLSRFLYQSASGWLNWVLFACGFFLAVAASGRGLGPRLVLGSFAVGGAVVALKGLLEYGQAFATEPTRRIFADWNNPNALAAMLLVCLFAALALASDEVAKRRWAWAAVAGLHAMALLLTQSRGGFLAAAVGLLAWAVMTVAWGGSKRLVVAAVPMAMVAGLFLVIGQATPQAAPGQAAPLQRVVDRGAEQEQSAGFRILLWRSSVDLMRDHPLGTGPSTYRFWSAQPGLTQQTHMAHQSFLHKGVESGVLGMVALLVLGLRWMLTMLQGARALPVERNLARAGVIAGVLASVAHGFIDSNLWYFGSGLAVFVLLGVGIQLSADGCGPERLPEQARRMTALVLCGFPLLGIWLVASVEVQKASVVGLFANGQIRQASDLVNRLRASYPWDGEVWFLSGLYSQEARDPQRRQEFLQEASERMPSTRVLRALARVQQQRGQTDEALETLNQALEMDPNNLPSLLLKLEWHDQLGDQEEAAEVARKMVGLLDEPYLVVAALPDVVPTEPAEALLFLARIEDDPNQKAQYLEQALDIYERYALRTLPKVRMFSRAGMPFAGETPETARESMLKARAAASELAAVYSGLGEGVLAAESLRRAGSFPLD